VSPGILNERKNHEESWMSPRSDRVLSAEAHFGLDHLVLRRWRVDVGSGGTGRLGLAQSCGPEQVKVGAVQHEKLATGSASFLAIG
jgi:hypothetical protein